MGSEVKMSKSEWGSKLLTILNTVGTLFKSERRRKQPAIANRNSRIQLIKIKKRGILWADLPLALVVVIAGSMVSKAGAIFPESVKVGRQPNGSVLVNTGQFITPAGKQIEFNGRPVAVTLSPDGKTAAFLNGVGSSQGKFIVVVDLSTGKLKQEFNPANGGASFDGITYSKDGSKLFASDASGKLVIANVAADGTLSLDASISLPDNKSYPGGLALSEDGQTLYIALSGKNSLGVFNLASRQLVNEIPVGNAPHAVLVAGHKAYVSNQGGRKAVEGDFTNDSFGTPIVADRETGGSITGTVSVVDLDTQTKTQDITVGLQPTGLMQHQKYLFVANTHSDSVSVIDTKTDQVVQTIEIQPFGGDVPAGSMPNSLAIVGNRLFVSLGTSNAIAVFNWKGAEQPASLQGLIPTGWYPGALAVDRDRKQLVVANVKGVGSLGPDYTTTIAGVSKTGKSTYAYLGSTSLISDPDSRDLPYYSAQVRQNNGLLNDRVSNKLGSPNAHPRAIPRRIGDPSLIKHVVYIIKENRTYDQVFADDARGNGDPSLLLFGETVTPNLHALVKRFPLLDNFYDSGVLSADGHQWSMQGIAPDYIEKAFGNFFRSYPFNGGDSLTYVPTGFLWDNALKHNKSVRVYGEYANQLTLAEGATGQFGNWIDWYKDALILEGKQTGNLHLPVGTYQSKSDVPSLDRLLVRNFPGYTNQIPDIYRAQIFLNEFKQASKGSCGLADLTIMALNTDHTSGTSANYPTPRAQVADNDLAVGRIVDAISHSPCWKDSAIFIVEDDSQNGVDHVDGHRTEALVISPYAKRSVVDSTYYTQVDMRRTIEQILGLPPTNQMTLIATPMYNAFTDKPDFTPFNAVPNQIALDELNPGSTTAMSKVQKAWFEASTKMFNKQGLVPDEQDENLLNRAIWYGTRGFNKPYPGDTKVLLPEEVTKLTASK
jgi:YVTN family beta-propeller protein